MSPTCLADSNVWLALLFVEHLHNEAARRWFDGLAAGEAGLCRMTQLGLIRLLGTSQIMGKHAVSASEAWRRVVALLEDERVEFLPEPADLDAYLPGPFRYKTPTRHLVNDAYLAAFAMASGRRLTTLDQGFLQFQGLEVELLAPKG